ncbi:MAG TPA: hypothetical protein VIK26_01485 [Clostridium sp.]
MDNNNAKKNFIINQGLIYLLIALVTFMITICFFKLIEFGTVDTQFVAKFEFGATISSIILSVVAIVYTLIQSKQSEAINAKVIDSADQIEKNSTILSDSVGDIKSEVSLLKNIDIDGVLKSNMINFGQKLGKLEELLNGGFKGIKESMDSFNFPNINKMDGQNIGTLDVKHLEFIVKSVSKDSIYGFPLHLCLYIVLHFYNYFDSNKSNIKSIHNAFHRYSRYIVKELDPLQPNQLRVANLDELIDQIYTLFLNIGFVSKEETLNIDKKIIIEALKQLRINANKFAPILEPCYKKIETSLVNFSDEEELE